jgi:mRNA-degrading endonuclease RelE of RelBE toxin-antitoxin system
MSNLPPLPWAVELLPSAQPEFERLLKSGRPEGKKAQIALATLESGPIDHHVAHLKGFPDEFRYKLGRLRIKFKVYYEARRIDVTHVGLRDDQTYR